jgi:hypothetical protein
MKHMIRFSVVVLILAVSWGQAARKEKTDAQIRQEIIAAGGARSGRNVPIT